MLQLNEMRMIVTSNMPYDTGFMSVNGARFFETAHFMLCKYDIERVPYIVYQEEGTIYSTKNKGFIRNKTMGDLLRHAAYKQAGLTAPFDELNERVKRRASTDMIKQGALEKVKGEYSASDI